jgi:hypothetical protein
VTVRQRIDHLAAEPPVGDLGYVADQRLVAGALLGLQLLADEIDAIKAGLAAAPDTGVGVGDDRDDRVMADDVDVDIADIVDQLAELTLQVKKLTKAVKKSTVTRDTDARDTDTWGTDTWGTGKSQKKRDKKSKKSAKPEIADGSPGLE